MIQKAALCYIIKNHLVYKIRRSLSYFNQVTDKKTELTPAQ